MMPKRYDSRRQSHNMWPVSLPCRVYVPSRLYFSADTRLNRAASAAPSNAASYTNERSIGQPVHRVLLATGEARSISGNNRGRKA